MCGFAGVVVWDERYRVSADTLARMGAAVAHRGPDGAGQHLSRAHGPITPATPQVGMAFRRLAILDPDPRSMQPFTDGRRWLVFNGEIYNFRDLRAELSDRHQWRTTGDTEVLLAAYAEWGPACVERLNGMFAFAVWDEQERTLCVARDRMGQKPLYRAVHVDGRIAFGSEMAVLHALEKPDSTIFGDRLRLYLERGYAPSGLVGQGRVDEVQPGETDVMGVGRMWTGGRAYFDANTCDTRSRSPEVARDVVRRAVEEQLVSDVPLGVFLSGGIDSSVIAACARRAGPVQTFSIGFDDPRYDESGHAAAVAKHLGTDHHTFRVTPDAVADLPKLAAVFGEPFGDSSALPTHYLSRETRRHVTVALSGDGGDELFGGYDRYRAMRWGQRLSPFAGGPVATLGRRLAGGHPKSKLTRAGRLLASIGRTDADRYDGYLRLFDDSLLAALWPARPTHGSATIAERFTALSAGRDAVQTALAVDRVTYLPGDLLVKTDRCSMLHGLEVRSPFMDPDVVTFAAGLTTDQLLKGGPKRMLREAFAADLPAWVFTRKKMGFAVPVGDWFRGPLRAMLRDTLFSAHAFGRSHFDMAVVRRLVDEHESKRVDHGQRLYALLMLELWWDTVRDGDRVR